MKPLSLLLILLSFSGAAGAALEFTVVNDKTGAQPIALVPMAGNQGLPLDIAQIVDADLTRSGEFRTLPRTDMLEKPSDPAQVNYRNWRAVNMDHVVIGSVRREGDRIGVRFYLMDTLKGEQVLAYDMPPVAPEQMRSMAHQVADIIYEKLTGIPGIFNTKIAYVASSGIGPARTYQLYVADADGENPRQIANSREPLMSPGWSPDRKRLAYVGYERGKQSIYLHTLASGQVRKLVSEKGINGSPAWSPDGRYLAVTLSFESNPDIYIIDTQSGTRQRITDHYGIDTESSWTPDGKGLVFVNLDGGSYRIAVMDLATRKMRIVSAGGLDESPSFAPNGAVIIYATQTKAGAELATVTTDGRVRQQVRQAGEVREPAWSPLIK